MTAWADLSHLGPLINESTTSVILSGTLQIPTPNRLIPCTASEFRILSFSLMSVRFLHYYERCERKGWFQVSAFAAIVGFGAHQT